MSLFLFFSYFISFSTLSKQVLSEKVKGEGTKLIAADLLDLKSPIEGIYFLKGDFTEPTIQDKIKQYLGTSERVVDLVLSDMAPNYSGDKRTDHERLIELAEEALRFSQQVLKKNGRFLCKISRGGTENDFKKLLQSVYEKVSFVKPPASRQDSTEIYIYAAGYLSKSETLK